MRIFFHLFERFYCLRFCFKEEYFAVPSGDPARRAIFVDNTNRIFIRHCNSQSNDFLLRFTSQNILLRQFYHYIACFFLFRSGDNQIRRFFRGKLICIYAEVIAVKASPFTGFTFTVPGSCTGAESWR